MTCRIDHNADLQQAVADAYYVLSDPARRAEYDSLFRSRPSSSWTDDTSSEFEQDQASSSFFENFSEFFKNASGAAGAAGPTASEKAGASSSSSSSGRGARPDAHGVFGDVFEEM
jgi:DnaJ-class molecular chaperone